MSVLNLGLQGVALARDVMDEEYEQEFKKCNGISAVRKVAKGYEKTPTVARDDEALLTEERDIETDDVAGSEIPTIEVDAGTTASVEKVVDEAFITEGRDVELVVTAGSEVTINEATSREMGNEGPLVTEVRDAELHVDAGRENPNIEDGTDFAGTVTRREIMNLW